MFTVASLHRPLLYLSYYLKRNRAEYYDRLMAIRENGDWEGWLTFFLRGVALTAEEATSTARSIIDQRERHRTLIQERGLGVNALRLLDVMFQRPILNVNLAKETLGVSFGTAAKLIEQLEEAGLLEEGTGGHRNRRFSYTPYLELFQEQESLTEAPAPLQTTAAD